MARTNKIRRANADPVVKLARTIVNAEQVAHGDWAIRDIANHSDADQRSMVRSGEKRTIRKKTKIEKLVTAKVLSAREGAACEWYADAHAMRYDTTGITAKYGDSAGGGKTNFDHLPKTREQEDAFRNFEFARAGISPMILPMFERVVLHGRPLGRLALTFRHAARQLLERIEGKVALK